MVTPIHRFQSADCRNANRPNVHRPSQLHRSSHHHNNHHHYHQGKQKKEANLQHSIASRNVRFMLLCFIHSDHHHTPRPPPHHEIQTHAEVNSTNYEEPADYSAVIHQ